MTNILFVCTGNTCRSPLAEALFRFKNKDKRFQAKSAGIYASDGMPMSHGSKTALSKRGIKESHQSKQVTEDLLNWADLVLTMTISHKKNLIQMYPNMVDKVFALKEYVLDDDESKAKLVQLNDHLAQIEIKRSIFFSENKDKLEQHSKTNNLYEHNKLEHELLLKLEPHYQAINELTAQLPSFDIADPYGGSENIYEQTFLEVQETIERLIRKLQKENS